MAVRYIATVSADGRHGGNLLTIGMCQLPALVGSNICSKSSGPVFMFCPFAMP